MITEVENKNDSLMYLGSSLTVFNPDTTTKDDYSDLCSNYHNLEMMVKHAIPEDYEEIITWFDDDDKKSFDPEDHEIFKFGRYLVVHATFDDAFYFYELM